MTPQPRIRIVGVFLAVVALAACAAERRPTVGSSPPVVTAPPSAEGDAWEEVDLQAVSQIEDGDDDGIFDERERALGTNPQSSDSDGDQLDDLFEDTMGEFGFDPRTVTADTDRDGLSDAYEKSSGTEISEPDTDGDGWGDFDEVLNRVFGYDPLRPSEDNGFDGLADDLENSLGTSSQSSDSDGDGLSDFEEYLIGLDPATPGDGGPVGELTGTTYSEAMGRALEDIRNGGSFPKELAKELPYPQVTEPLVTEGLVRPSAALMQQSVSNPENSPGLYDQYNEIVGKLFDTARAFDGNPNPRIVRLFRWSRRTLECCDAAGNNKPGLRLYALKISDNPQTNEDEREILFMGLHHARELITAAISMRFIKDLTDQYAAGNAKGKALADNAEVWVISIVNPDGYTRAVGQRARGANVAWRKNARNVDPTNQLRWGVDLNRNYGFEHISTLAPAQRLLALQGRDRGANGIDNRGDLNINSEPYPGPGPFTEVETQAVRGLAENRFQTGDEVTGLKCSLSLHSAVGVVANISVPQQAA